MPMPRPVRALLFDLDGTLVDSETQTDEAISLVMARHGVAGFALPDSRGVWQGMDVDLCRGLATGSAASALGWAGLGLLAALLFQEKLQPITLLGGSLILAAVILLTRNELRPAERDSSLAAARLERYMAGA